MTKSKKVILGFLVIWVLLIIFILFQLNLKMNKSLNSTQNNENNQSNKDDKVMNQNININVSISGKEYIAILENNDTVKAFLKILPQEFRMSDLNDNEKYVYMDKSLPTNYYNPKYIEAGDIMLYGDNCLVIFYKSFTISYSYTKIGHIDNLLELDGNDVYISFNY